MNDESLILLVEQNSAEDLTLQQLTEIRARLADSPPLCDALRDRIEFEQQIAGTIGGCNVPVSAILAHVSTLGTAAAATTSAWAIWSWKLGLSLLVVTSVSVYTLVSLVGNNNHNNAPQKNRNQQQIPQKAPIVKPTIVKPTIEPVVPVIPDEDLEDEPSPSDTFNEDFDNDDDNIEDPPPPPPTDLKKPKKPDPDKNHPKSTTPTAGSSSSSQSTGVSAAENEKIQAKPSAIINFRQFAFTEDHQLKFSPSQDDLKQWFTKVNRHRHQITTHRTGNREYSQINGLAKFKPPWKSDTVVRLAMDQHHKLKLHFFQGQQGVTIHFFQKPTAAIAAYITHRKSNSPVPEKLAMATTDEGRYHATGMNHQRDQYRKGYPSGLDIWHQQGYLVVSRGDVIILTVAMEKKPEEVFFEGKASICTLQIVRVKNFPQLPQAKSHTNLLVKLATSAWDIQHSEADQFQKLADGSFTLSRKSTGEASWAALKLPNRVPAEIVMQLENVSAGSGFFLAEKNGKPSWVGLISEHQNDGYSVKATRHGDTNIRQRSSWSERPVALLGKNPWIKIVIGCGHIQCYVSQDGLHWGRAFAPTKYDQQRYTHCGICCAKISQNNHITIKRLELRRLRGLMSLVPEKLLNLAPLIQPHHKESWLSRVWQEMPANVDPQSWQLACALRSLSRGVDATFGNQLLSYFVDQAIRRKLSLKKKIAVLDDISRLSDVWTDRSRAIKLLRDYEQAAISAYDDGEDDTFETINHAQMIAPLCTPYQRMPLVDQIFRIALIKSVYQNDWEKIAQRCQQTRFYCHEFKLPLWHWANAWSQKQLPKKLQTLTDLRRSWPHPLVETINRKQFNFLSELNSCISAKAYESAASMLAGAPGELFQSTNHLASQENDSALLLSLTMSIRQAILSEPQFREVMKKKYEPLAKLRLRQAIEKEDSKRVRQIAWRFLGTTSSKQARLWLADRALVLGDFQNAIAHYRFAEPFLSQEEKELIAQKQQLAAAKLSDFSEEMQTSKIAKKVTSDPPMINQWSMNDFQNTVRRLYQENRKRNGSPTLRKQRRLIPSGFQIKRSGNFIARYSRVPPMSWQKPAEFYKDIVPLDYRGHSISFRSDQQNIVVADPTQIVMHRLSDGKQKWQQHWLSNLQELRNFVPTPNRPLMLGDSVYYRHFSNQTIRLVSAEIENGKKRWETHFSKNEQVISDPMFGGRHILFMTASSVESNEKTELALVLIDPRSGKVRQRIQLLDLNENWQQMMVCQTTIHEALIYTSLGGVTFCCTTAGEIRWLRKHHWLSRLEDRQSATHRYRPPIVRGDKLYVFQPGVPLLTCLDRRFGKMVWKKVIPNIITLLDITLLDIGEQSAIIKTTSGIEIYDAKNGKLRWRYPASAQEINFIAANKKHLIVARRYPLDRNINHQEYSILWLDLRDGKQDSAATLDIPADRNASLGPIHLTPQGIWACYQRSSGNQPRELIHLTARGEAENKNLPLSASRPSPNSKNLQFHAAIHRFWPDWRLLEDESQSLQSWKISPEYQGQRNLLQLQLKPNHSILLAKQLSIPSNQSTTLRGMIAIEKNKSVNIKLIAQGKVISQQTIKTKKGKPNWQDFRIDLSALRGKKVWLLLRFQGLPSTTSEFYLKLPQFENK